MVLGDARRHGIPVLSPDVNCSEDHCTLEEDSIRGVLAVRLGLRYVKHVGPVARERLLDARGDRPFSGLRDLCLRTRLPREVVEALIRSGAADCLSPDGTPPDGTLAEPQPIALGATFPRLPAPYIRSGNRHRACFPARVD